MDIREAVDALKTASRVFGSLASVGEAAETALSLVNHGDELRAEVARLQAEIVGLTNTISDARATETRKLIETKANGERTLREYAEKIAAIDAELRAAKADRQAKIDAEVQTADRAVGQIKAAFDHAKANFDADRARITAEHDAFIEETKVHRAQIEAKTAALEAHLNELKDKVSAALA